MTNYDGLFDSQQLDDETIRSLKREYFKGTILVPLIIIFLTLPVSVFLILLDTSFSITIACGIIAVIDLFILIRVIAGLVILAKIGNRSFTWDTGTVTGYHHHFQARSDRFYEVVDGKYMCSVTINPIYRKGTKVCLLAVGNPDMGGQMILIKIED